MSRCSRGCESLGPPSEGLSAHMTPRPVSRPLHPSWVLPLLPQFTRCLFWGVSEVNAWPQTHELGRALSFKILASGWGPDTRGTHSVSCTHIAGSSDSQAAPSLSGGQVCATCRGPESSNPARKALKIDVSSFSSSWCVHLPRHWQCQGLQAGLLSLSHLLKKLLQTDRFCSWKPLPGFSLGTSQGLAGPGRGSSICGEPGVGVSTSSTHVLPFPGHQERWLPREWESGCQ